jgi:formate dehydrogenase major subunit
VPGLGASFGRGGTTTNQIDVQHADAVVIMGSTMAECHPVGFRFVMKAKLNGAAILHIDPRFTRTSAMADVYAPLRAGSDVVFLVGLINHVLVHEAYFRGYVVNYTNAACLIHEGYQDSEDLDGLFSGFDAQGRRYDPATWRYDNGVNKGGESTSPPSDKPGDAESLSARVGQISRPPLTDPTLRHPRCVFQILKRHYARYTPELVERVCGTSPETFLKVAEALIRASGPDRTAVICYAVGWTQHTTGVQTIRASTILQLLLGNIGRPGGGILALRGHASIQGSTDIPTLYNLLPEYLNTPSALKTHETLAHYIATEMTPTGYWANFPKFIISLLKSS